MAATGIDDDLNRRDGAGPDSAAHEGERFRGLNVVRDCGDRSGCQLQPEDGERGASEHDGRYDENEQWPRDDTASDARPQSRRDVSVGHESWHTNGSNPSTSQE